MGRKGRLQNIRQTVSSISESLGGRIQGPSKPAFVTIINAAKWTKGQADIHSGSRKADPAAVLAHFPALKDEPAVALAFDAPRHLLAVAGLSGQTLNLFAILPHPSGTDSSFIVSQRP